MLPSMTNRWLLVLTTVLYFAASPVSAQVSMYSDPKASQPGDVITIVLDERTTAQRQSTWEKNSSASKGAFSGVGGNGLAGQFSADAEFNSNTESRNESVQRDALEGTFTANIVEVDDSGNLIIEGERHLNINGETHLMRVTGRVRPYDVRYNNSVLSHKIANANIEYREAGRRSRRFAPGFLTRAGAVAAAGLGIILAVF